MVISACAEILLVSGQSLNSSSAFDRSAKLSPELPSIAIRQRTSALAPGSLIRPRAPRTAVH